MNWFSLLKVQRQTQRQGVSAKQKDEEFIFEDEDDDCYEKLIAFITGEGFKLKGSKLQGDYVKEDEIIGVNALAKYKPPSNSIFSLRHNAGQIVPDKVWCSVLDHLSRIIRVSSGNLFETNWDNPPQSSTYVPQELSSDVFVTTAFSFVEKKMKFIKREYYFKGPTKNHHLLTYFVYNPEFREGQK